LICSTRINFDFDFDRSDINPTQHKMAKTQALKKMTAMKKAVAVKKAVAMKKTVKKTVKKAVKKTTVKKKVAEKKVQVVKKKKNKRVKQYYIIPELEEKWRKAEQKEAEKNLANIKKKKNLKTLTGEELMLVLRENACGYPFKNEKYFKEAERRGALYLESEETLMVLRPDKIKNCKNFERDVLKKLKHGDDITEIAFEPAGVPARLRDIAFDFNGFGALLKKYSKFQNERSDSKYLLF
jgi:hypothetical protein